MKKLMKTAGLLALMIPLAASADDFTYTTNSDNTITITKYTGPDGAIIIPDTISGLSVTVIGERAFERCTNLTSVTIANSITNIENYAFQTCTKLTNATVSPNVSKIGNSAFNGCRLSNVILPDGVISIGYQAFYQCTLTSVTIPNHVTNIGRGAFAGCSNLLEITVNTNNPFYSSADGALFNKNKTTLSAYPSGKSGSYTIPNSVTSIGDSAFWSCKNVSNVTIPDSVTNIDKLAFLGCSSLTSITIPASVTNFGFGPFAACTCLNEITVDPLNSFYCSFDGVLFDKNQIMLVQYPAGKTEHYYSIPTSVTDIGDSAFHACINLTTVVIPISVTSIGYNTFYGCVLTSITIPNNVTNIGHQAFLNCSKLKSVYFAGDAPSIVATAFNNATNVTVYYMPTASGWSATLAGRPTVLWNPNIQTDDADFGVRSNRFGFNISATNDFTVVVEACTNLADGIWVPVETNTLTEGSIQFSDSTWTNYPNRYYRVSMPQ